MTFRIVVTLALAAAACVPQVAVARSPLKAADMRNIRHDAGQRAKRFQRAYHAQSSSVDCQKRTPYSARCRIKLVGALGSYSTRRDCTITAVYLVRANSIEGSVAHDGCDS